MFFRSSGGDFFVSAGFCPPEGFEVSADLLTGDFAERLAAIASKPTSRRERSFGMEKRTAKWWRCPLLILEWRWRLVHLRCFAYKRVRLANYCNAKLTC